MPIGFIDESTLLLAMADPANVLALDDVQMATGLNCQVAVAPGADIDSLVSKLTTLQSTVAEAIAEDEEEEEAEDEAEITDIRASAEDAPVIKLVNSILGQAVTEGASDIHFETGEGEMRIRFRIDGVLQEAAQGAEANGRGRRLAHQDHERARHRREADPAGRPGRSDDRGPPRRPARDHAADPARRGRLDPHPR